MYFPVSFFSVPLFWYQIVLFGMLPRFVWNVIMRMEQSILVLFEKKYAAALCSELKEEKVDSPVTILQAERFL